MQKNEVDKFFEGLPSQDRPAEEILNEGKTPEKPEKVDSPEKDDEPRKNRQQRRLEKQLEESRQANIELNERVRQLAEQVNSPKRQTLQDDSIDPRVARLFANTDEGKEGARQLMEILEQRESAIQDQILEKMRAEQEAEMEEQKKYEDLIDSQLEALEDEYNVDLTSTAPSARKARNEFLELVKNLSPKDENGELTGYADFQTTFEIYREQTQKEVPETNTRQKEIASRSMQRSGTGSYQEPPKGNMNFNRARREIERQFGNN